MANFISFTVVCKECGKRNRPSTSPIISMIEILSGGYTKCRHCQTEWKLIIVPNRSVVKKLINEGLSIAPTIQIRNYKGKVPSAYALC